MALETIVAGVTRVFTQRLAQHGQKTLETEKKINKASMNTSLWLRMIHAVSKI